MVRPRARAALRLITSSNFVACSTGISAGFAATSSIVASRRNRLFGTIRVFGRSALTPFRSPFVCRPT